MTTQKQQEALEASLSKWVFDGIADSWSLTDILSQINKDWRKVMGTSAGTPGSMQELAKWQGEVLEMFAVGTNEEIRLKQMRKDIEIVRGNTSMDGSAPVMEAFGESIISDILRGFPLTRETIGAVTS